MSEKCPRLLCIPLHIGHLTLLISKIHKHKLHNLSFNFIILMRMLSQKNKMGYFLNKFRESEILLKRGQICVNLRKIEQEGQT